MAADQSTPFRSLSSLLCEERAFFRKCRGLTSVISDLQASECYSVTSSSTAWVNLWTFQLVFRGWRSPPTHRFRLLNFTYFTLLYLLLRNEPSKVSGLPAADQSTPFRSLSSLLCEERAFFRKCRGLTSVISDLQASECYSVTSSSTAWVNLWTFQLVFRHCLEAGKYRWHESTKCQRHQPSRWEGVW